MERNSTPYSSLKIFHHFEKLQELKEGQRVAPIYIRIKPTNKCNHNCNYCHYRNQYLDLKEYSYGDSIPKQKMYEIIEDISKMGVKAITFSGGGEPLIYDYIEEAMQRILDKGIDLSIITNGSMLKGKKAEILTNAKWVRISMESATDETYCKIRGIKKGSHIEVCENIKNFAKIKNKTCELGINFVIGKDNFKEVYEMAKLVKNLGVNHIKFASAISNNVEEYHKNIKQNVIEQIHKAIDDFEDEKFKIINLYEKDFETCDVFERTYSNCPIKNIVCVIGADSKVYYCHDKAYLDNGIVGDISNISFKELWFSDEVTKKFKEFNPKFECKHHCVYDGRNVLINTFLELDENHINFI